LKAISGRMMSCGSIQWGRNVQMSFFEQDSSDLAPDKTALMELWDRFPQSSERQLRTLLGGLGLSGDEVFKQVGVLSGGERARLKLARLMLEEGNVLVLDEPTNHLDIPAKEALEAALAAYEGTILVVSHDRWLLSRLPTRILHLENGTAQCYQGAFDAFLAARGAEQTPPAISAPSQGEALSASCGDYHRSRAQRAAEAARRKRFAELETEIEQTESALSAVETALADPANAGDYQTLTELTESIGALQVSLEALYAEWDSFM
ncbi:MAG: ATP-binding cassette domain-containing protein, partial [Oscillospiraceae bacterium]